MTVSTSIRLICSSVTVVQSSSSTLTEGDPCSVRLFCWMLFLSFCRTVGWQSLKTNLFGLQERQMVIPVNPTPLPSSRTDLQKNFKTVFKLKDRCDETLISIIQITDLICARGFADLIKIFFSLITEEGWIPAREDLLVVHSPLCQVECSLPGHQASGSFWDQSYILQQADSITTGLHHTNQH